MCFLLTHVLCYAMLISWSQQRDSFDLGISTRTGPTRQRFGRASAPLEAALEQAVPSDVLPGQQMSQVRSSRPKTLQNPMVSMTSFPH